MSQIFWQNNKYDIYLPHNRALDSAQLKLQHMQKRGARTIVAKHSYLKHVIWDSSLTKKTETRLSKFLNRFVNSRQVKV